MDRVIPLVVIPTWWRPGELYRYTADLEELSKERPMRGQGLPEWLTQVNTPLVLAEWRKLLEQYPDPDIGSTY